MMIVELLSWPVRHRVAILTVFVVLLTSLTFGLPGQASASSTSLYNFNAAGDLSRLFNSQIGAGTVEETAAGGLAGTRGVEVTGDRSANAVFSTKEGYSLGPVGSTYTFSSFVKSEGNNGYSGVGFSAGAPGNSGSVGGIYRPSDSLGISVHGGGFIFHNGPNDYSGSWGSNNAGITTVSAAAVCTDLLNSVRTDCGSPDKWYKIVFQVVVAADNKFNVLVEVWPANQDGTLRYGSASASFKIDGLVNSAITSAPVIFSYFNLSGHRVTFFDDYSVSLAGGATFVQAGFPVVVSSSVTRSGGIVTAQGNVTSDGGSPVTERGFVYGTASSPTISDSKISHGSNSSGTYSVTSTTLSAGTYYFRPFVTTAVGTSYGAESSIVVPPGPPLIPNTGFEDGTTDGWTASSSPLVSFPSTITSDGEGAGRISGDVRFNHGSRSARPNCEAAVASGHWIFGPASSKSGALQPNGSHTFAAAVTALGLSAGDKSAIENLLITQASTGCLGQSNPTDAAWIKRTVTLEADTVYHMWWNYLGTDYVPYNDGSLTSLVYSGPAVSPAPTVTVNNQNQNYALLGFTNPGTGDYSTGSYGSTGWQFATYEVSVTGDYVLGFAAFNIGDTGLSPLLLIDDARGTVTKNGSPFSSVPSNNPNAPSLPGVPGIPTITSVVSGSGQLQVNFTAPASNGGATITNYQYSTDGVNYLPLSTPSTASPITISFLSSDGTTPLVNGTAYPITLKAVNSEGAGAASSAVSGTPQAPAASAGGAGGTTVQRAITPIVPQPPRQVTLPLQPPVQAPVLRNNQTPTPPTTPQALLNGVPTQLQSQVTDPNNLNLRTGVLNIGMNVRSDQGLVRQGTNGQTEVQVRSGGVAGFQGTGLAPRSFVQVFMPLQGNNAKELARIPVDQNGSFNGEAVFQTSFQEAPLPIGRQVLQMVTVDEQGRQNVVEITVNIVQPQPAPELNRQDGTTPQLRPGQSLATNAGVPEVVEVTVIEDQKQTVIEGDGWAMSIAPEDENSNVIQNEDGEVFLELVRDEAAAVSGTGFLPGTRADIWLFSEPTLLGTVDIDENGEFNGTVEIDGQMVNVGEHTLQMQGVGMDGYVRAANLGVVVNDADAASTEEAAGSFLWWWLLFLLLIAIAVGAYLWWRKRQFEATG